MFKSVFLVFLFTWGNSHVSADCSRFVPTPIWNFQDLMGSWQVSGLVDYHLPSADLRYVEMGSSWTLANADDTFEMWTYGSMIDSEGSELMFDDWRIAKVLDTNRPGYLVHFRDTVLFSNATILYFDNNFILWVACSIHNDTLEETSMAYMGSRSGNIPDFYKEQFKSILAVDYGMDVDNKYINIPQESHATTYKA
ncbi:uncharacterized protein LOC110863044 [Folsomia candida]|uniref:uncharacterized protein LOC110863044 n=1 Tax=Folsomia candida TaxID=158441 RepID=UPI000B90126E|nr:uncharacterized protein LOC110863044 [Folsomia candida]